MPIALSNDELQIVLAAALPLPMSDRDRFLQAVADELAKHPVLGAGLISRVARDVQRQILSPPSFRSNWHVGKYSG